MGIVYSLYKKLVCHRYDDPGYLRYFTAEDFPGLMALRATFLSSGTLLRGNYYFYPEHGDSLVVFCHGIGGGHLSYTREIERLCRMGFTVLAYDNTGCFASGGKDIGGLSASLRDLDAVLTGLKDSGMGERYSHLFVFGHSWGGYAAANIPLFHPEVEKCVAVSGFLSVETFLRAVAEEKRLPFGEAIIKKLLAGEKRVSPRHWDAHAANAVEKTGTKFFFIHDVNDPTVPFAPNTGALQKRFPGLYCRVTTDRFHNPNYTPEAAALLNTTFGRFAAETRKGKLRTLKARQAFFADADWRAMTEQDENFWTEVENFLN